MRKTGVYDARALQNSTRFKREAFPPVTAERDRYEGVEALRNAKTKKAPARGFSGKW